MATTIQNTTNSTSPTTGSFVTQGGVGIVKDLWVGGNINVAGTTNIPTDPNVLTEINNLSSNVADLQNAVGSVNDAATSAANAAQSELDAVQAKNDAIQAKIDAVAAAGEAAGSASQSATSATNAAASETGAGNSATAASNSASQAGTYATNAGNSASLASDKATLAANAQSAAGNSASAAATSATQASASATNAANSASAAAISYTSLEARVTTAESAITTEQTTRANADSAINTSLTNLTSTVGTNTSNITNLTTTVTNNQTSNASAISTLNSTVGSHTTSISTLTSTTDGLNARWGVTVNNNGSISGIVLNSTGASNGGIPTTSVVIAADKFAIVDPAVNYTSGNTPPAASIPFEIVSGQTILKEASIRQTISSYNYNGTSQGWRIDRNGNIITYGSLEVRDTSGNIILTTGANAGVEWNKVNGSGKPENNATVGANGSNLSVSVSGNMFPNSDFAAGIQNWFVSWVQGGGTNYTMTRDVAGEYWSPAGGHSISAVRNGTTDAASGYFDIMYDKYFPIQAGITFELSAYLAAHRCPIWICCAYYTSAQAYITENAFGTNSPPLGGNDLNNWYRAGGILTTPANTAYIRIFVRGAPATAADPYFWATRIFFGLTKAGQTQLTPWSAASPSGSFAELSQINSGNVGTYLAPESIPSTYIANLAASKITTGYLDAARINVKTLTANKLVNNTLVRTNSVFGNTLTLANNTQNGLGFTKDMTHRDYGDYLVFKFYGGCDAGTTAVRTIGFAIYGNCYVWDGVDGYNLMTTLSGMTLTHLSREKLLSYASTVSTGSRHAVAAMSTLVRYLPGWTPQLDIQNGGYVYEGDVVISTSTISVAFVIKQASGASVTASEITLTLEDTYA